MTLNDLNNRKIAILGLGIENDALVSFLLKKKVKCDITVCDKRLDAPAMQSLKKNKSIKGKLGETYNQNLDQFDILFRAPGWPMDCPGIQAALKKKVILSSPMKLFMDICPTKNIIGVTGSKGKGTTSSLIYHILKKAKKRAYLGGNIGVAPFAFISKIKQTDWVVLELSSFQLEDMDKSPYISVITNFTKEHLAPADPNNPNYHKTMASYWQAKANIFKHQTNSDYIIVNQKIANKVKGKDNEKNRSQIKSKLIIFTKSNLDTPLVGEHNKENIAAAIEVAKILKIKEDMVKKAVASFKGLEHRIELVKKENNISYYNDTFATTPESAITAINSFNSPIILLAGGADKGSDFKQLAKVIKQRVKYIILFNGKGSDRIKKELNNIKYQKSNMQTVDSMQEAVRIAKQQAQSGDIVLLSPACASFGIFQNYKERGKLFKQEMKAK